MNQQVVLITGATDGLGKRVARAHARAYDEEARRRLRRLSERLADLAASDS